MVIRYLTPEQETHLAQCRSDLETIGVLRSELKELRKNYLGDNFYSTANGLKNNIFVLQGELSKAIKALTKAEYYLATDIAEWLVE